MSKKNWLSLALAATAGVVCLLSGSARAQAVGGHVGVALPLVSISKETTTVADQTVIATPFGIGFPLTDALKVDFETIVLTQVHPTGTTGFIVDPGLIYNWGPVATGLRIAFKVGHSANVGMIPLVNLPLLRMAHATWFAEAAFPTFYEDHKGSFTAVLHTGFGF
jgi:hypothetical protein